MYSSMNETCYKRSRPTSITTNVQRGRGANDSGNTRIGDTKVKSKDLA